jgi:hypothetical protein
MRRSERALARLSPSGSATHNAHTGLGRVVAALPFAAPALVLAWLSIAAVLKKVGHPGAALDDSYIHFQYARAIVEGHPFRYFDGQPRTMGATSALWPALLAPFYAIGFRENLILWPAWGLSFVALGVLAREVMLLARPLAGSYASMGAAAMVFAFSPFTWCAGSGMEVLPFTLCLVRAARRGSEWAEATTDAEAPRARELVVLAFAAPLFRPEGALASVVVAVAFVASIRPARSTKRLALAAAALVGAVAPQLLSKAVTGSFRSNTALVKLLPGNPYYVGPVLRRAIEQNVHTLVHTLLDGEVWSAEFIPHGSMPFALAGLGCVAWFGVRSRRLAYRTASILVLAAAIAVPCAYVSFLWNRLRYLWPFAPFWIVGAACLARVVGDVLGSVRPRWRLATPLVAWGIAGLFAAKLDGTIDDLADSASGIDRQQVTLGKWAAHALEPTDTVGVNDTGAIAYFGGHRTFDIVGLTTQDEGRYWVAGAASRFEHYERLKLTAPAVLPDVFIIYRQWMGMDGLFLRRLQEATVTDSTILGGQTMVADVPDWNLLGTGARPWSWGYDAKGAPAPLDELDVADLESEAEHRYELLGGDDGDETVTAGESPTKHPVMDGGRRERSRDRYRLGRIPEGRPIHGVVRLGATDTTYVTVTVDGAPAGRFTLSTASWTEQPLALPGAHTGSVVELTPETGTLTTYHYWVFDGPAPP